MWKSCQEARRRTQVMTADPDALPRQNRRRNLAGFIVRLGILEIEGKSKKAAQPSGLFYWMNSLWRQSQTRNGPHFVGTHIALASRSVFAGLSLAPRAPFTGISLALRWPLARFAVASRSFLARLSLALCSLFILTNASLVHTNDALVYRNASLVRTNASLILVSQLTCPLSGASLVYTNDALVCTNDVIHAHIVT
jgi:hypothetical protein